MTSQFHFEATGFADQLYAIDVETGARVAVERGERWVRGEDWKKLNAQAAELFKSSTASMTAQHLANEVLLKRVRELEAILGRGASMN